MRKDFVSPLRLTRERSFVNEQRNRPLPSCYLVTHSCSAFGYWSFTSVLVSHVNAAFVYTILECHTYVYYGFHFSDRSGGGCGRVETLHFLDRSRIRDGSGWMGIRGTVTPSVKSIVGSKGDSSSDIWTDNRKKDSLYIRRNTER